MIEYRIDHARRLVLAKGRGTLTDQDVFGYQKEVWSRPDVAGYGELMDMSEVEQVELPAPGRIRDLAALSLRWILRRGPNSRSSRRRTSRMAWDGCTRRTAA
jgi:hypothetical protein